MSEFFKEIHQSVMNQSASLSKFTLNTYLSHISKIRQFRPNLDTNAIDERFLEDYVKFMQNRKNKEGTMYRSLAVLRKFVNMLRKNGVMKNSPFENYRMPRVRNRRDYLEIDELRALYDGYFKKMRKMTYAESEAMRAFLFSCFTGLRYADLKNLCSEDIKSGKIHKWTQKTGQMVYIPIPRQALSLVDLTGCGPVLHVVNNSTFNKNLRSAAHKIGFSRRLHTHLARHTFATSCISLGIPIEVVSKMLGHSALQTTLIYANYADAAIDRVMSKFEV